MQVTDLDDALEVAQYSLEKEAQIWVEGGQIYIRSPFSFYTATGTQVGREYVDHILQGTESDDLLAILAPILNRTDTAIETEHGWTKKA